MSSTSFLKGDRQCIPFLDEEISTQNVHIEIEDKLVTIQLEEKMIQTDRLVSIEKKECQILDFQQRTLFLISSIILGLNLSYNVFCMIHNRHPMYSLGQIGMNLAAEVLLWKRKNILQIIEGATIENNKNMIIKNLIMQNKRTNYEIKKN